MKLPRETIMDLTELHAFLPAYHLNKSTWIAVRLAQINQNELAKLIDQSFALTE